MTKEGVWLRVLSNSFIASLPDGVREGEVRPAVEGWVGRHADRFQLRKGGGGGDEQPVAMFDIVTEAFVCKRR